MMIPQHDEEQGEIVVSDLLDSLYEIMGEIDAIEVQEKKTKSRRKWLEDQLTIKSRQQTKTSFSDKHISASVKDQIVFGVDKDEFESVLIWALMTGNTKIFKKELNTKACRELVAAGVEFPEGITLAIFSKVSLRRKTK